MREMPLFSNHLCPWWVETAGSPAAVRVPYHEAEASAKRKGESMKTAALALFLAVGIMPASASELAKTYTYFSIRGATMADIDRELARRGPSVGGGNERHPGATRMEFRTKLGYAATGNSCTIRTVKVQVRAKVILPRWYPPRRASFETRFVWDTLASDIRRHEEQHVAIANSYGRKLESALKTVGRQRNCAIAGEKAQKISDRILGQHDRAQQRFDAAESAGFERRLSKLLKQRLRELKRS